MFSKVNLWDQGSSKTWFDQSVKFLGHWIHPSKNMQNTNQVLCQSEHLQKYEQKFAITYSSTLIFWKKKSLLLLHTDVGHLTFLNVLLNHPSDRILQQCINSTLSCIWASRISSHGSLYLPFLRQGLDNFSYIKKYIWIRRPIPGILTSNPVHGRISKTANVEKILMASLERIPCFHGLQRFLQPP